MASDKAEWEKVAADTAEKYGGIDIVVNNAAIMAMKGIMDASAEEFLSVYQTNCLSVLLSVQAVVPYMEKAGGGSIVNIDSIGGLTSGDADGGDATYSASKGGTRALTKHAAIQFAAKKIRVNTIHPGGILTPMLKSVYDATPALWDRVKETCPLPPHVSDTMDIANGALFLASDESRTVTGSELVMDCAIWRTKTEKNTTTSASNEAEVVFSASRHHRKDNNPPLVEYISPPAQCDNASSQPIFSMCR